MFLNIIISILGVLEVLCAILLICIILLQKSRSHGAAGGLAFGAGMGESLFGAQATTVLTKITTILTIFFLVNTTILAVLGGRVHRGGGQSVTDIIPAATPLPAQSAPMAPQGMPGPIQSPAPVAAPMPAGPVMPGSGVVGEPVQIDAPAPAPENPATP